MIHCWYDLGQDEMSLAVYMASKDARPALTECYLYGENDIGIERSELAELAADGGLFELCCSAL